MREMEERARQLLDVARERHNPGPTDAARVRARLKARVLAEPALLQAASKPASKPPFEGSLLRKLLLTFAAGGVAGFAAGLYVAHTFAPGATAQTANAPTAVAPSSVAASSAVAAHGAVTEPTTGPTTSDELSIALAASADSRRKLSEPPGPLPRSTKTSSRNGPSPLKAELDGLRRAQELLHQGEPAWALARLNELDRAQVGSVLLEERAATRASAACLLGHDPKAQAGEFERRFPRSAHLEQVRASCSGAQQSGTPSPFAQPQQTETPASRHE